MADKINEKCKVCKLNVSGGHKCLECQENIHLTCGKGAGEEGMVRPWCATFAKTKTKAVFQLFQKIKLSSKKIATKMKIILKPLSSR